MKINEVIREGVLGSVGKGLADIVAPGAVEKYQAVKTSQAINQQKDTVNINGNIYKLIDSLGNYQWAKIDNLGNTTPVPANIQNQLDLLSGRINPPKAGVNKSNNKSSIIVPPYTKPRSTTKYPANASPVTTQQPTPQQQTTPSGIIIPAGARTATPQTQTKTATVTPVITPKTKILPQRNPGMPTPDEQAKFQAKLKAAMDAQK